MEQPTIRCTVERYAVIDGELQRDLRLETTGYHVKGDYVYLHNCVASAPLADLIAGAHVGRGWLAQFGMPPVYLVPTPDDPGGWGGRNWPEIRIDAADLLKLGEELSEPKEN